MNTLLQYSNLFAFVIYFILVIILLVKTSNLLSSNALSFFLTGFMIWSFFSYKFFEFQQSREMVYLYLNISSIGWIFLSSLYLFFIIILTKKKNILRNKYLYYFLFGIPIIFLVAQWTGKMSSPEIVGYVWKNVWENSRFWKYPFFVYVVIVNSLSFYFSIKMIKQSYCSMRIRQLKIIAFSGLTVFIIIFLSEIVVQEIFNTKAVLNIGSIIGVPWGIFAVYGIVKYRSLDIIPEFIKDNVVNIMYDGLLVLNKEKRITVINNSAENILEYSENEIKNNCLNIILNKEFNNLVLDKINANEEVKNEEVKFTSKSGNDVIAILSTSIIKIGDIENTVCIIKDISKLKRDEKIKDVLLNISEASRTIKDLTELSRRVHQQVSLLMDAENFYIALIHDEAKGTYTFPYIVDVNPEEYVEPNIPVALKNGLTHFVYKSKKPLLVKDKVSETIFKKYGIKIIGIDAKSWLGVPLKVTDDKIIGVIALQSYSNANKYSNEDLNVLSIISNTIASVIEHWQTEETLIQLEKIEVVGKLAGGVAHDLNNVLGAIVSYPDLILKKLPENSPMIKTVTSIQQSGLKAAAIVQDLLTLARRGVAITTVVNLNEIIKDYIESPVFEKLKMYHSDIIVEKKFEKRRTSIRGSALHLSKTIMNLVSNAAESITGKGKIIISTELVSLNVDKIGYYHSIKKGKYVLLRVSDTGSGIPESDLNKIFEPFYTKKKMGRSGTGLGMAVVWGTVEDHKGFIDVISEEGVGTVFELFFPISDKENSDYKKDDLTVSDYKGNGEKILIIDDLLTQREIATSLLTELGYEVFTASSGENGVKFLETNNVDICIIDMIMDKGIDGLDTYKLIRELKPKQRVIIASGYSETSRVKEAIKLGVQDYVSKPYTLKKIGLTVKKVLES